MNLGWLMSGWCASRLFFSPSRAAEASCFGTEDHTPKPVHPTRCFFFASMREIPGVYALKEWTLFFSFLSCRKYFNVRVPHLGGKRNKSEGVIVCFIADPPSLLTNQQTRLPKLARPTSGAWPASATFLIFPLVFLSPGDPLVLPCGIWKKTKLDNKNRK